MGMSYFYQPTAMRTELDIDAPSLFAATFEEVFGEMPVTLGGDCLGRLCAMAAMVSKIQGRSNPWTQLADALRKYGEIRVFGES